MVNSRQKGKRIELEAVKFLKSIGIECRRSQQYSGAGHDFDIEIPDAPNLKIEVKGVSGLDLGTKLMDQYCEKAEADAPYESKAEWFILWKKPRMGWRLTFINHEVMDLSSPTCRVTLDRPEDIKEWIVEAYKYHSGFYER